MPVELTCVNCQKSFQTKPYRAHIPYCCGACRTEHLGNKVSLSCAQCGGVFETWKSQVKKEKRFCSKACKDAAFTKPAEPKVRKRSDPVVKLCGTCGVEFKVPECRAESAKYCSKPCMHASPEFRDLVKKAQTKPVGKERQTARGYISLRLRGDSKRVSTFSHRVAVAEAIQLESPDHPFLIEVDGVKRLNPTIHVHHIDRNGLNNDLKNLLAVTAGAHKRIHTNGKKPEPWECWPSNPSNW
jgi:hypothetical protein